MAEHTREDSHTKDNRIDVYLICNAKYHDTNFARLELLKLLAEHEDVVVRVAEDYQAIVFKPPPVG